MRKLITIVFILFAAQGFGQVYQQNKTYGWEYKRLKIDSTLHAPTFNGLPTLRGSVIGNQGAVAIDSTNNRFYFYNPKDSSWNNVAASTGTIIVSSDGVDSVTYSSNELCQWVDGVSTCYLLNKFFDSTSYNEGKIYYYNNGSLRDSTDISSKDTVDVGNGLGVTWENDRQKIFAIHPDGYEGGIVTYSGTGFDFNVSPITLYLRNEVFLFPATTLTLSAPNSLPRYDIFGVDSLGAFVKSGDSAALPIEPQVGVDSFALTKAFLISPGDTAPSNIGTVIIYDEHTINEYTAGYEGAASTIDFDNTDNPKHISKATYISSYHNGAQWYFYDPTYTRITPQSDQVITGWVYLNDSTTNDFAVFLADSNLTTSNYLYLSDYGIDRNNPNVYQQFSIPVNNFSFHGTGKYTTIEFQAIGSDTSGAGGLYMDYVNLQSGIQNIPSSIDYSNKQDSNYVRNDSLFWCAKGICNFIAKIGTCDTCISTVNISADSTLLYFIRVNGDTARAVDFYGSGGITQSQLDDSTAAIRSDKQDNLTLTTTGTSGAATLTGSTLNIPNYATGGGTGGISQLGSPTFGLTRLNDSTYVADTVNGLTSKLRGDSLASGISQKIDSVKLSTDSVFAKKNGSWVFQFKSPAFANWLTNGTKIYTTAANVGIMNSDPEAKLTINNDTLLNKTSLGISLLNITTPTSGNYAFSPSIKFSGRGIVSSVNKSLNFYQYVQPNAAIGSNLRGSLKIDRLFDSVGTPSNIFELTDIGGLTIGGNFNNGGNAINGGSLNVIGTVSGNVVNSSIGGINTTINDGVVISAVTAVNSLTPVAYGRTFRMSGNAWNGSTSQTTDFRIFHQPVDGTNPLTSNTFFQTQSSGAGYVDAMNIKSTAEVSFYKSVSINNSVGSIPSSRIFQIVSTTQASSPFPVMTESEKNSITSPNVGDHVYQTDGTEGVYVYKSDSTWHFAY